MTCSGFIPLTWSPRDTPDTIVGIKGHNAAWTETCGE